MAPEKILASCEEPGRSQHVAEKDYLFADVSKVTESSSVVSFALGPMFLRFLFSGAAKFMTAPGVPLHRLQLQGVQ